ncbi:hypothetical protein DDQ41_11055 [Streptomyces spongiicola]|uniref:Uncharacterized protein n=1 Tax=Streptomyces spongiicola TaxID=1690221 RepID=A0ABM6V5Y8_9ACTN|nr:hypothetical protein [Streptomyces spongiicola]AWK09372.1 hypothetical protein DDQ41_11055 [Streptomyces spongiicola]
MQHGKHEPTARTTIRGRDGAPRADDGRNRADDGPDRTAAHSRSGQHEHARGRVRARRGRRERHRALRRDVPAVVGLLADDEDFAVMRRYPTFAFDDHPDYLRHAEGLLKALAAQCGHTTVALFDPEEFAHYCRETGLDPDSSASRSRYTAEVAATGPTVAYTGQPLDELVPLLLDRTARHATWQYATSLLDALGSGPDRGPDRGEDAGRSAFRRASGLLAGLLDGAGPGTHHLVCSVPAEEGEQLLAVLHTTRPADAPAVLDSFEAAEFTAVLAVGVALESPGGVVLRTSGPGIPDRLHGWRLHGGRLLALTEAEVFSAYCTDAGTGEPLSPEPGVEYRAGFDVDGEHP